MMSNVKPTNWNLKLRNFIFELESGYPALDVIFWYKLIDWTGELRPTGRSMWGIV